MEEAWTTRDGASGRQSQDFEEAHSKGIDEYKSVLSPGAHTPWSHALQRRHMRVSVTNRHSRRSVKGVRHWGAIRTNTFTTLSRQDVQQTNMSYDC
jgi:hypothetical protein